LDLVAKEVSKKPSGFKYNFLLPVADKRYLYLFPTRLSGLVQALANRVQEDKKEGPADFQSA